MSVIRRMVKEVLQVGNYLMLFKVLFFFFEKKFYAFKKNLTFFCICNFIKKSSNREVIKTFIFLNIFDNIFDTFEHVGI